jgi:ABC-type microcin C transport system permease subunit YejE
VKALVIAVVALALLASPAMANQCPLLIKQLNDAVAKMKVDDPKVKQGKELIAEAQKLHDGGKHADSVAKADEAAKVLGVTLKKK